MEQSRAIELLTALQAEANLLLERLSIKDHMDVQVVDEGHCDPVVRFGDSSIEVVAFLDKHDREWYCVGRVVYDPGVRYYPDGSGEPPSEDFSEIRNIPAGSPLNTAAFAITEALKMLVDEVATGRGEELMFKESEEMNEQMDRDDGPSVLDKKGTEQ